MKKKTNLDELAHGEYLDYLEDVRRRENKSNISEEAKKLLEKKHRVSGRHRTQKAL